MFAHLNTHSNFSLGWGVPTPEELCRAATETGCSAIAMTDTANLYGLLVFLQYAREYDFRPLVGAEAQSRNGRQRATLLVENRVGYSNLCHLLTDYHLAGDFDLTEQLLRRREGLTVLTPDPELLTALREAPGRLYAELTRGEAVYEILQTARRLGVKPVATERSFWLKSDEAEVHRLLRAIQKNCALTDLQPGDILTDARLLNEREMREGFSFCPEAVDNTLEAAEAAGWTPDFGVVYPSVGADAEGGAMGQLRRLAYEGAKWRYGEVNESVRERLEHELALIEGKGFAPVFLAVKDIVEQSSLTCGRGSAAASIVSYCLGITHVEPIRHKLFFERFINPARVDPPDIDVDFAWDERDDVLNYVFEKHGVERAAMVSNHVCFKPRMALRETAKVFGLPELEINEVTSRMGWGYSMTGLPITDHPALKEHGFAPPWPEILRLAQQLLGIPRHLSVHCGGVVITPDDTANYVPTELATKGVRVLQWEKDQTEDSGLVKIDLLGNRSLAVIRDAAAAVHEHTGVSLDYASFNPLDDPATQALIARGDTFGVFYVESPATRLLAKKAGKGDYEHLVIHSSIIRPAANRFINDYLKRLRGEPWQSLHPLIGDILDDNYGIMCYQEDVTRVAMSLAGFDIAEADELRKILSKKHKKRRLEDLKHKFYTGAAGRGVEEDVIDRIWDMIMSFSGYSFCKPHSASYALVSFKSAYLRAHYPAEFMAAVISNGGGYYSAMSYVSEAKRMGLRILPPDVNASEIAYKGRDGWIRVGLMQIKGLGAETQQRVVEARGGGLYTGLDDLVKRAGLNPSEARLLVLAGACDSIEPGSTRPEMMWRINTLERRKPAAPQAELFAAAAPALPATPQYDERTLLMQELETLGFLISRHPLELYRDRWDPRRVVTAATMDKHVGQRVEMVGWMVTSKPVLTNARAAGWEVIGKEDEDRPQELREFVTFEDLTGLIETVVFPRVYARFGHVLTNSRPFRLFGLVEEDFGAVTLTVEGVRFL